MKDIRVTKISYTDESKEENSRLITRLIEQVLLNQLGVNSLQAGWLLMQNKSDDQQADDTKLAKCHLDDPTKIGL